MSYPVFTLSGQIKLRPFSCAAASLGLAFIARIHPLVFFSGLAPNLLLTTVITLRILLLSWGQERGRVTVHFY
jgi:hypothetical protein